MTKMTAAEALIDVLVSWNVKHIYGIPGSSVNGLMGALSNKKEQLNYIQVRHESAGAMAASAHAKFTGEIGVAFGSGGPGGSNLINGLYDAKMDRVPMLAIVGQSDSSFLNTRYFQELNQLPIYADVATYYKQATTAEQVPYLIEEGIREAYKASGVSVIILPNNFLEAEIEFSGYISNKKITNQALFSPDLEEVNQTLSLIEKAENPVLFVGLGLKNNQNTVEAFSDYFKMPIVASAPSTGWSVSSNHPNFLGSFGRLGTKAGFDAMMNADLVLFVGSDMPFARYWPKELKVIQINNDVADIGRQLPLVQGVLADGADYLNELKRRGKEVSERAFLEASKKIKKIGIVGLEKIQDILKENYMPNQSF